MVSVSEAVVVVKVDGEKKLSVSESFDAQGCDRGPVNALWQALAKDLGGLTGAHRVEEGRHDGIIHLGRARAVWMAAIGVKAIDPAALAVVDCVQKVDAY